MHSKKSNSIKNVTIYLVEISQYKYGDLVQMLKNPSKPSKSIIMLIKMYLIFIDIFEIDEIKVSSHFVLVNTLADNSRVFFFFHFLHCIEHISFSIQLCQFLKVFILFDCRHRVKCYRASL